MINKKKQLDIFDFDYILVKSAKEFKQELSKIGCFYTDPKLAALMASCFPDDVKEIYDPTCGNGALLEAFPNALKYGQDINDCDNPNIIFKKGDTLKNDLFKDKDFNYIVANPPFSIVWEQNSRLSINGIMAPKSKADYSFILHCYYKVKKIFVCLCFPGVLYRGNAEGKIRESLIKEKHIKLIRQIPSGFFQDTKIQTSLIVFDKEHEYEEIEFVNENEISKKVSLSEIANNNYTLSVSTYIQEESKKEKIDINVLNKQVLDISLENFKNKLKADYFIATYFHNPYFKTYLNELLKTCKEYKHKTETTQNVSVEDVKKALEIQQQFFDFGA